MQGVAERGGGERWGADTDDELLGSDGEEVLYCGDSKELLGREENDELLSGKENKEILGGRGMISFSSAGKTTRFFAVSQMHWRQGKATSLVKYSVFFIFEVTSNDIVMCQ